MKAPPMRRAPMPKARIRGYAAFDLETGNIAAGETPDMRFLSLADATGVRGWECRSLGELHDRVLSEMFTPARRGWAYYAHNSNRFDGLFIALAFLHDTDWEIHPYIAKAGGVRGFKFRHTPSKRTYQILDTIAATGIAKPLDEYLKLFATRIQKRDIGIKRGVQFDPDNPEHVQYALDDSAGLYEALCTINQILIDLVGSTLKATIGNLGVHFMMSEMPEGKTCRDVPRLCAEQLTGSYIKGGYVWCTQQYDGPCDKYDENQAYADVMRTTDLPAGSCCYTVIYEPGYCGVYRVHAVAEREQYAPFYVRDLRTGEPYAAFDEFYADIDNGDIEILREFGWRVDVQWGHFWSDRFSLRAMVDKLEALRMTCDGGPSGPIGTMIKYIGNNAFGKTLERFNNIELRYAAQCPGDGWYPYAAEGAGEYVWFRETDPETQLRAYHKPQIGGFITAEARRRVYRALIENRGIYTDTDSLIVPAGTPVNLDIHPSKYGCWKQEECGARMIVLGKKVYANIDETAIHAKGLHVKKLTMDQMREWFDKGEPPTQIQVQRIKLETIIGGAPMFRRQERRGTDFAHNKALAMRGRRFIPHKISKPAPDLTPPHLRL